MGKIQLTIKGIEIKGFEINCDAEDLHKVKDIFREKAERYSKELVSEIISHGEQTEQPVSEKIVYVPKPLGTSAFKYEDFDEAKKKPRKDLKDLYSLEGISNFPSDDINLKYTAHCATVVSDLMTDKLYLRKDSVKNHFDKEIIATLEGELLDGRIIWMKYPDYHMRKLTFDQFQAWTLFQCLPEEVKAERMRLYDQYVNYISLFSVQTETSEEIEKRAKAFLAMSDEEQMYEVISKDIGDYPTVDEVKYVMDQLSNMREFFKKGQLGLVTLKETLFKANILKARREVQSAAEDCLKKYGTFYKNISDPDIITKLMQPSITDAEREALIRKYGENSAKALVLEEVNAFLHDKDIQDAEDKEKERIATEALEGSLREKQHKEKVKKAKEENKKAEILEAEIAAEKKRVKETPTILDPKPVEDDSNDLPEAFSETDVKEPEDWFDIEAPEVKKVPIEDSVKPNTLTKPSDSGIPHKEKDDWETKEVLFPRATGLGATEVNTMAKPKSGLQFFDNDDSSEVKDRKINEFDTKPTPGKKQIPLKDNKKTLSFGGEVFDEGSADMKINTNAEPAPYDGFFERPLKSAKTRW